MCGLVDSHVHRTPAVDEESTKVIDMVFTAIPLFLPYCLCQFSTSCEEYIMIGYVWYRRRSTTLYGYDSRSECILL